MKHIQTAFLLSLLVSLIYLPQPSLATKARLGALGQDTDGSHFILDERNIFLNPAAIHRLDEQTSFEMGSASGTPKAQGGMIYKGDTYNMGVYLGRRGMATASISSTASDLSLTSLQLPQNSVDFIMGGSTTLDWGAGIHWARYNDDQETGTADNKANALELSGGIAKEKMEGYVAVALAHNSETEQPGGSTVEYDGKISGRIGGTYSLNESQHIGGEIAQASADFDNGAGVTGSHLIRTIEIEFFRKVPTEKEGLLFYSAGLKNASATSEYDTSGATDREVSVLSLPVTIGLERSVRPWLTLRGSVKQNVLIDSVSLKDLPDDQKTVGADNTVVAVGVSVIYDDVRIDSTLAGSTTGQVDGNSLMTNASLVYNF